MRRAGEARIWSRQRKDLTDRFPDVAAAAVRQLPDGAVVDGELVILGTDGKLSFDALQRRLVTSPAKARHLVATVPASYVAFDLLAIGGIDLRTQRWTVRRNRLEQLATGWTLYPDQAVRGEVWPRRRAAVGPPVWRSPGCRWSGGGGFGSDV